MAAALRRLGARPASHAAQDLRAIPLAPLVVLALGSLLANLTTFGGDPEIHLVFAKNLVAGYPLQFNPGIFSSGETSPLYLTLLAAILALTGPVPTILFMKSLGVASAFGLLWLLREEGRAELGSVRAAEFVCAALAAAPSFFFQAQLGMENMPFALAIAFAIVRARERGSAVLAVMAHVLFFWRPEALVLVGFLYCLALRDRRWPALAMYFGCSVMLAAAVFWLERGTGAPLQGAGSMRAITSRQHALHIAGTSLYLSPSPLAFVAYAWPLLFAIGMRVKHLDSTRWLMLTCFVCIPMLLHALTIFPTTHFSRYTLYVWVPLACVFMRATRVTPVMQNLCLAAFVLNTGLVAVAEIGVRMRASSFANLELLRAIESVKPGVVRQTSDRWCAELDCRRVPISIALQEVQLRLVLDERFIVRSLDGVVDSDLRHFLTSSGELDLPAYLETKRVDLVLDFPGALANIFADTEHGAVTVGCSRYRRRRLNDPRYSVALERSDVPDCRPH